MRFGATAAAGRGSGERVVSWMRIFPRAGAVELGDAAEEALVLSHLGERKIGGEETN